MTRKIDPIFDVFGPGSSPHAPYIAASRKEPQVKKMIPPRKNRLSTLREQRSLTQKEVGKLLDLDFTTISKHESGDRGLTDTEIAKYAKLYKVQSYELFIEPQVQP